MLVRYNEQPPHMPAKEYGDLVGKVVRVLKEEEAWHGEPFYLVGSTEFDGPGCPGHWVMARCFDAEEA